MWKLFIIYAALLYQICLAEENSTISRISPTPYMIVGDPVGLLPGAGRTEIFCNGTHPAYCYTKVSEDTKNRTIARGLPQSAAAFKCPLLFNLTRFNGIQRWYLFNTSQLIGSYDFTKKESHTFWSRNGTYKVLEDGGLLIAYGRREVVDKYICILESIRPLPGANSSEVLYRLDFSSWYSSVVFDSVFYGSVIVSLLLCGVTFVINLIWIAIQNGGLYWIKRRERESRVQSMIQAVEVYRQRQIQNLQDAYHRNVGMIRDHYHLQVEQIRDAYTTQISRLRDYRQARMENVTSHLESLRENYNQQLSRMREYGSRHGEQLLESYERQLNRVRTFSLQQRLKLMRQYKLKQRHVNKLLADVEDPNRIEEEGEHGLRDVFNLGEEIFPVEPSPLRRSISCLSLPEFTLVDGTDAPELQEIKPARRLTNQMDLRQFRKPQKKTVSESEAGASPQVTPTKEALKPISSIEVSAPSAKPPSTETDPLLEK